MAGKNWMWSVRFIMPQFHNAILVLLNVTAQNSICKRFSLHATINWLYPNSTAPSMRVKVMGQAILRTQRILYFKVPG